MKKYVYFYNEGNKEMKSLLGGKGANIAEMSKIGLPVPPAFTVTTDGCKSYYENEKKLDKDMEEEIFGNIKKLESITGKLFGDINNPLLVSVRSGAVVSMPGMMDTVLNLGLNDDTVNGLIKQTNNGRFAYDSYRRFIQMFGDVVLDIPKYRFDTILDLVKKESNVYNDIDLSVDNLIEIIKQYKKVVRTETGKDFPQDVKLQLLMAVEAVFSSWNNHRAIIYRNINNISHDLGTAVNIQSMVFGNMGQDSGTGVAFTRNPSTGENKVFGEFLIDAQGEDVVAGIRTPKDIHRLSEIMPDVYKEFMKIAKKLENHYLDMQDIEFTIEKGKLYLLQTRTGKRTVKAASSIAVDLVEEGIIDKETALLRIEPSELDKLLHPTFKKDDLKTAEVIAKGLPASPGSVCGKIYFTSEDILEAKDKGEKGILVRMETSPEDIEGMVNAEGILTTRGGMTSHAAVVARGMGKCCIAGCGEIAVEEHNRLFRIGNKIYKEGEYISLDGNTGVIYKGFIDTESVELSGKFTKLMEWADEVKKLNVRVNADTPRDSKIAVKFGAEGIGLCRTEHMFFDKERIINVRKMIVADSFEERKEALDKLLPYQKSDFKEIFMVMGERPVTIRLLDPPLHEFLPHNDDDAKILAEELNIKYEILKEKIDNIKEFNPMLGHRGCRLAITYPEIYKMQVEAIINAAIEVKKENKLDIKPEIMVPLIGDEKELEIIKNIIEDLADKIIKNNNIQLEYKVGTMIEVPRAALTADDIAKHAEFFSFGTNDLTQMTYAFSRDDSGKFINEYRNKDIFENDPFSTIDIKGVGKLMKIAIDLGRKVKPDLKIGICGEQGGDPKSIEFCHNINLDYVSCSPFRVPIAKLSAAQSSIRNKQSVTVDA